MPIRRVVSSIILPFLLVACGPELTEPGKPPVTGRWATADYIPSLTDLTLDLQQTDEGAISGFWSGHTAPGDYGCPKLPLSGCRVKVMLNGEHTVLQIRLEILGAGTFTGQIEGDTMRGHLLQNIGSFPVRFTRLP